MFYEKDYRDSKETNADKYFPYISPSTSPKTTHYILKEDLENLKEGELPKINDFGVGGACYYKNTKGKYGGSACKAHFLKSKEIVDYLIKDPAFIKSAVEQNVVWFLPEDMCDTFVF